MVSRRILRLAPTLLGAALSVGASLPAAAVTQYKKQRQPFRFDITAFTTTLSLPVTDELETIKMSESLLQTRLERSATDETVEPLTLVVTDSETSIAKMAEKIASSGREDDFAAYLAKALPTAKPIKENADRDKPVAKTVTIDRDGFELLDKDAFAELYAKTHHKLTVATPELKRNRGLRHELVQQMVPFFKKSERQAILDKILKGETLDVDHELLPNFARRMVRKFIAFRGPNCFHAALAFHSPQMTSSSLINVKKEAGYHRAMINYDELWRAISRNFYEVNPEKMPLKYGDMLVFFDVPDDAADDLDVPVDFRWIRHTATYLFNGYTFSKGSKSPNTPYTVRTLLEEWQTWKRFTSNLGVKVFRRSQRSVKLEPPMDLSDWIY